MMKSLKNLEELQGNQNVMNKYHNRKVKYGRYTFDSAKEANSYLKLRLMEKAGLITNLQRQVKYELQPSFKVGNKTIRTITYIADFVYTDKDGSEHIVDVKGFKTEGYKLKAKMFAYKYGKEIEEWK